VSVLSAVELQVAPDPEEPEPIAAAASALANTLPDLSTATQESDAKHETTSRPSAGSIRRTCQAAAPPVGSVLSTAWPSPSTATQTAFGVQDTDVSGVVLSIVTGANHALAAASVGLGVKSARPALSTATQKAFDAHDTDVSGVVPSIVTADQDPGPTDGLRPMIARPSPSTATHSAVEGQEIELNVLPPSIANVDHDHAAALAERVPTTARPASSTATHSVAAGHAIAVSLWPASTSVGPDQVRDVVAAARAGVKARQPTQISSARAARRVGCGEWGGTL